MGFVTGLALLIIVKQLPKLLGIEGGEGNAWQRLYELVDPLAARPTSPTLVTGVLCLVLLVVLEHFYHRIPAALVALVFGIAISAAFGLEGRGVEVVGEIPSGLAAPSWPDVALNEWWLLLPGAMGLALVNFAEAIGPSRSFASAHRYEISADQELIGLGAANVGAGLFQGFPIGSSLSKSAANDRAGAHSQMSGIIAAAATAVVALFFTQWFAALPEATLGAIVIVAVSSMVKVAKMKHLYRVRHADFALALVALLAVLTVETLEALLIAVIVSLLALVWRVSQPRLAVLGREPDTLVFSDVGRHPENTTVPGLLIVRPENGLFFANAEGIAEAILGETRSGAEPVRAVLLDLGATTDLDVPSADVLARMAEELSGSDVRLMLTRVIAPVLGDDGARRRHGGDRSGGRLRPPARGDPGLPLVPVRCRRCPGAASERGHQGARAAAGARVERPGRATGRARRDPEESGRGDRAQRHLRPGSLVDPQPRAP